VRVIIAAACSLGAITLMLRAAGAPEALALVGVLVAMTLQVAVTDPSDPDQRRSWWWVTLAACAAAVAGMLAAPFPAARDALFLAVVFVSVFTRRYGPRATACGFAGFIAFFDGVVVHPPASAAPLVVATILAAAAVSYAIRFSVVPERSTQTLAWTRRAVEAAARLHVASGADPTRRLRTQRGLFYAGLAMDREVTALAEAGAIGRQDATLLRRRILEVQRDAGAVSGARLASITLPVVNPAAPIPIVNFNPLPSYQRLPGARIDMYTRQAIQALCGTALALAGGEWVSRERWYWAVVTAFVVFSRAPTANHTISRAFERVAGTALGLAIGLVIAEVLPSSAAVALPVIFICAGVAYYFLKTAYGVTLVCFTVALAMLYSMMGQFSPGLLYLRLGLTVVGALAGAVAATFILPTRTQLFVVHQASIFFGDVSAVMACGARRSACDHIDVIRRMDASLEHLINAATALRQASAWRPSDRSLVRLTDRASAIADRLRRAAVAGQSMPSSNWRN
jgi:uncharacterized membrane protein YgaE (UPF0421/DUF939 family)